ncbi:MAG TPA: hypothetical protein PKD26_13980 [Pyrinomonadaceae bacterium]|nr:hypothetical protein [Pyrinomonadaceae bacterium]
MYRRPRFLEVLIRIREEMAREADYDTDLFAELVRTGRKTNSRKAHSLSEGLNGEALERKTEERTKRKRK